MNDLFLRKGADQRLRGGHLWVYSNEVDSQRSALTTFTSGDLVTVRSVNNAALGCAYMEPNALICARLYASGEQQPLDVQWFSARLKAALALRQAVFDQPFYRLVYGDSDGLPGIIIDRFGDVLVMQLNNAGLERYRASLCQALIATLQPQGILLRQDSRMRREQGLPTESAVIYGEVAQQVHLLENDVRFLVPVFDGQKTGWFYDHRMSRARLRDWVGGKAVLDVYSYIGGWGIQAAVHGAQSVCCVDSSATALQGVVANAQLNAVADRVSTRKGPAADVMAALHDQGSRFGVVVLDPPAFIQRKKDLKKGIAAYRRINELALQLVQPGGLLVTASCSMHMTRAELIATVQKAAVRVGSPIRIVEQGAQGPDHPVHPAIPETEYLKAVFVHKSA